MHGSQVAHVCARETIDEVVHRTRVNEAGGVSARVRKQSDLVGFFVRYQGQHDRGTAAKASTLISRVSGLSADALMDAERIA